MSEYKYQPDYFGKVAVLLGGFSPERPISILSGERVLAALQSKGLNAHALDPAKESLEELVHQKFDRVFIVLHGENGEDGTIQGALEFLGLPYTGSGILASALSMNKAFAKEIWQANQLKTPRFHVVDPDDSLDFDMNQLAKKLGGFPVVVKPSCSGSSIGLSVAENAEQLIQSIKKAQAADLEELSTCSFSFLSEKNKVPPPSKLRLKPVLVEEFIKGQEFTVSILGTGRSAKALPLIEIKVPTNGLYDYDRKYLSHAVEYICPAVIQDVTAEMIQNAAVKAYCSLGCKGWGRVDLILRDDSVFLLEVNTVPGMTEHSHVPAAAQAIGINYPDLCTFILSEMSYHNKISSGAISRALVV